MAVEDGVAVGRGLALGNAVGAGEGAGAAAVEGDGLGATTAAAWLVDAPASHPAVMPLTATVKSPAMIQRLDTCAPSWCAMESPARRRLPG